MSLFCIVSLSVFGDTPATAGIQICNTVVSRYIDVGYFNTTGYCDTAESSLPNSSNSWYKNLHLYW